MPIFGKSSSAKGVVAVACGVALLTSCDSGTYADKVELHEVPPRSFAWEDSMQLGVFHPNGVKHMVTSRGEIPANAYHAVRLNLPEAPQKTPPTPEGLTWRVVDVLEDAPKVALSTELELRHDAYVGHAGRWGADIVAVRARVLAESSEGSEESDDLDARSESLQAVLGQGSPTTGEAFEIPDIDNDRRLRFVWAQRPTLADFALDPVRPLERGLMVVGDCDGCDDARNWAAGKGVRVVSLDDPESDEIRRFFGVVLGKEKVRLPFVWTSDAIATGFDQSKWDQLFHVKQDQ